VLLATVSPPPPAVNPAWRTLMDKLGEQSCEAYRRIARRITGEKDLPFVALEEPDTFWTVMKRWIGFGPAKEVAQ
jgi:hypothetical protein